jgi:hypothetical protein
VTTDGLVDYRESHSWIRDEYGNILIQNNYNYFDFNMDLDNWIPDVSGFYYYNCYN